MGSRRRYGTETDENSPCAGEFFIMIDARERRGGYMLIHIVKNGDTSAVSQGSTTFPSGRSWPSTASRMRIAWPWRGACHTDGGCVCTRPRRRHAGGDRTGLRVLGPGHRKEQPHRKPDASCRAGATDTGNQTYRSVRGHAAANRGALRISPGECCAPQTAWRTPTHLPGQFPHPTAPPLYAGH
jgi:hypothetical protein